MIITKSLKETPGCFWWYSSCWTRSCKRTLRKSRNMDGSGFSGKQDCQCTHKKGARKKEKALFIYDDQAALNGYLYILASWKQAQRLFPLISGLQKNCALCSNVSEAGVIIFFGEEFIERITSVKTELDLSITTYIFTGHKNQTPGFADHIDDFIHNADVRNPDIELNITDDAAIYFTSGTTGVL